MKKFIIVFGIGISIFFAGSTQAENTEIICSTWSGNSSLQTACKSAKKAQIDVQKWINLSATEEINIRKADMIDKDGYLYKAEECTGDICNMNEEGGQREEQIALLKGAKITYARGYILMKQIAENKDKYSQKTKELFFLEAIDYFRQAEKLARKPVIHSGGVLPGPNSEESGESYLMNKFLVKFVNGSLILLFSIGTLILIIGGLMFIFSSGNDEMKTKAKDTIFWGIIGIVIAVMAYAIVKFVIGLDFGI